MAGDDRPRPGSPRVYETNPSSPGAAAPPPGTTAGTGGAAARNVGVYDRPTGGVARSSKSIVWIVAVLLLVILAAVYFI